MTPEEKFNREMWWVLQEIAEEKLATTEGKPVEFKVVEFLASGIPSRDRQINIIHKLQEWKAIKILNEFPADWRGSRRHLFELQLLEPKFAEIYSKFQKACDLQKYLNTYQKTVLEDIKKGRINSKQAKFLNLDTTQQKPTPALDLKTEFDQWLGSKDERTIRRMWQVVSAINYEWELTDQDTFKIPLEKFARERITNEHDLEVILTNLHNKKIIMVLRKLGETPPTNDPNKAQGSIWATINDKPEIIHRNDTQIEIFPKRFSYLVSKLNSLVKEQSKEDRSATSVDYPSEFLIIVKDREIWINNYLIAKPHAVGSNFDFFEYIQSQPANQKIERKNLNDELKKDLDMKTFFKILNALGFKDEIKRAFFYKVDAHTLCYRGNKLTLQQLKKDGINTKLFIKELETADAKYNPD